MTEPRPVYVTEPAHSGTDDRIFYATWLLMAAVVVAAAYSVWRGVRR